MSVRPDARPRVLIALSHVRLREAIVAAVASSTQVAVVAEVGDLESAIRETRLLEADGLVIGTGLLDGDVTSALRAIAAALPGVRIVVVGTESSDAYGRAMEAAGATAYVLLQTGADALSTSLQLAMQSDGAA